MKPSTKIGHRFEAGPAASRGRRWRTVVVAVAVGLIALAVPRVAAAEPAPATRSEACRGATVAAALEVIGVSFTADDGAVRARPIYSIAVGDPRPGEERAAAWSGRFGMYAVDGSLWTRMSPDSNARWRLTLLRRPRTLEEVEAFQAAPTAFMSEIVGGPDLLPHPFDCLSDRDLSRLEYLVHYAAGGIRAELRVGTTDADGEGILRRASQVD